MTRQVITIQDLPAHKTGPFDLDGWRFSEIGDGVHIIDLRLGLGLMIYAFALKDRYPLDWRLMLIDCAVAEVDFQIEGTELRWDCDRLVLPVPVPGPPLCLLDGPTPGEYEVVAATVEAQADPFSWEFRVELQSPQYGLVVDQSGRWRLVDAVGRELVQKPMFSVGFQVFGRGEKARWRLDESAA